MKIEIEIKFYLKLLLLAFFAITNSFAVDMIKENDNTRCGFFNESPNDESRYLQNTAEINQTLGDEKKVNPKKSASVAEKEIILKAVMATFIIHGDLHKLVTPTLGETHALYYHYEILRLTEELTHKLVSQYKDEKKIDIACFSGYENLYAYSGLEQQMLALWFTDAMFAHKAGIDKLMAEKVEKEFYQSDIRGRTTAQNSGRTSTESVDSEDIPREIEEALDEEDNVSLIIPIDASPRVNFTATSAELIVHSPRPTTNTSNSSVFTNNAPNEISENGESNKIVASFIAPDGASTNDILRGKHNRKSYAFAIQNFSYGGKSLREALEMSDEMLVKLRKDLADFAEFYPKVEGFSNILIPHYKLHDKRKAAELEKDQRIADKKIQKLNDIRDKNNDELSNDIELASYALNKNVICIWNNNEGNHSLFFAYNNGENFIENTDTDVDLTSQNTIHLLYNEEEGCYHPLKREENTPITKLCNFFRLYN